MSRNVVLGRFKVRHSLARGGMGEIFLADDVVTGGKAVLKVLREDIDGDGATARFEHEIDVLKSLSHPLVPHHLADGHWDGKRVVALAHVEGVSLAEIMVTLSKPMPAHLACFLLVDVLRALHRSHTLQMDDGAPRGLVHRDVSPHNVLCDARGRAHVIDFGVSTDASFADVTPGVLVGKVAYMAPEQASGFTVDHRADQFAAGVVLWELLAGKRLFRGDSDQKTWRNVLACVVPDIAELAGVPRAVAAVVKKMLDANRTLRFANCNVAADALLMAAAELPMGDGPSMTELIEKAKKKQKKQAPLLPKTDVVAVDAGGPL